MLASKYRLTRSEVSKLAKCEHFCRKDQFLIKFQENQKSNCRISIAISRKIKLPNAKKGQLRRKIKAQFLKVQNKDIKHLDFLIILLQFKQGDNFLNLPQILSDI